MADDIQFVDQAAPAVQSLSDAAPDPVNSQAGSGGMYPKAMLQVNDKYLGECKSWLDQWIRDLISAQQGKMKDWADQERAYRALPEPKKTRPYVGADTTVIPAIAMAVDPIHARLNTGIFKQDPVFQFKGLKKSVLKYIPAVSAWVDYYQKHKLKLRQVASPRILECTKLGTMIFKTVYDRQAAKIITYDPSTWEVVPKTEVRFDGPRVFGVSIGDLLFPPSYQHLQDCPIVVERIRTTYSNLKVAEASGKLVNVDDIRNLQVNERTELESAREDVSNHKPASRLNDELVVYECWFDYDIDGDGLPEHLVATVHLDTRTLLQLRYNWYFHQRKPYTLIPYTVTNESLYGIGIGEMVKPFQDALTKWHQMATDNAYLANIRMFIVKKQSGIEEVPRLYAGRCFFVDDPKSDFIPFSSSEIYPSTLTERQNLFGMAEKRTGVSDYLTGRESPIIGSRATATSTLALIQEGTKRVEEVLENIRVGFAEIIENCVYIWIQYGLGGLDDIVFGDDEIGQLLKEFFSQMSPQNVNGALAIDLSATDAAGNRQALQQMQLQIIQIMMQYLEKTLSAGQAALQAEQTMPQFTAMIVDVMTAARKMFKDLLNKYDIRNPEEYLPDLEKYLGGQSVAGQLGQGGEGGSVVPPSGSATAQGLPGGVGTLARLGVPQPAAPGSGGSPAPGFSAPGQGAGY
jgi:hypothetical protein